MKLSFAESERIMERSGTPAAPVVRLGLTRASGSSARGRPTTAARPWLGPSVGDRKRQVRSLGNGFGYLLRS
jgi:hypothetical protein